MLTLVRKHVCFCENAFVLKTILTHELETADTYAEQGDVGEETSDATSPILYLKTRAKELMNSRPPILEAQHHPCAHDEEEPSARVGGRRGAAKKAAVVGVEKKA